MVSIGRRNSRRSYLSTQYLQIILSFSVFGQRTLRVMASIGRYYDPTNANLIGSPGIWSIPYSSISCEIKLIRVYMYCVQRALVSVLSEEWRQSEKEAPHNFDPTYAILIESPSIPLILIDPFHPLRFAAWFHILQNFESGCLIKFGEWSLQSMVLILDGIS